MSDRFGAYSVSAAIKAGLDLEKPGPTGFGGSILNHALESNDLKQTDVDNRARTVLKLVKKSGRTGTPENAGERANDNEETSRISWKVAGEAMVPIKFEDCVLLLKKEKKVLLIGQHALQSVHRGGGSSPMVPYYASIPLDAIEAKVSSKSNIS